MGLSWKVLNYSSNERKIVDYEIFSNKYEEELKRARKNKKFTDRESLKEYLRKDFQYHFWSRAECEISVGSLYCKENEFEKIDIYRQLLMNLDRITDYVINEMNFRFKKR